MSEAAETAPPILFVGLNYAPEPVGIGPYSAGLCEGLAAAGHRVTAVVGQPYYPQWRRYEGQPGGWQRSEEAGVAVLRCPHYVPANPTGLRRVLHLASFAASALVPAVAGALKQRPAAVIAVAPALLGVIPAWLAARASGARLWVHVQDFEVEAAFATGLMTASSPWSRLARAIEGWILRRADMVSAISPQMVARLEEKGVPPEQRYELRNWADPRFALDTEGAAALRREWNLGSRAVALYSGNIARKQGIEVLVEAARLLAGRPDIAFVICGEGPNRANLAALAEGLPNVQLRDLQPAGRMGAMLALADLHLLPQIAGAADLVLPSKLTNMLASGRPVVATAEPGTGLHAEVEGCGVNVAPEDAAALAAATAALVDDPARRSALGLAAAARANERWLRAAILARFRTALARLVSPAPGDRSLPRPRA